MAHVWREHLQFSKREIEQIERKAKQQQKQQARIVCVFICRIFVYNAFDFYNGIVYLRTTERERMCVFVCVSFAFSQKINTHIVELSKP